MLKAGSPRVSSTGEERKYFLGWNDDSRIIVNSRKQTITVKSYSVNHHPIQTLLAWVESDKITIPELQCPFVWDTAKVHNFIVSLYFGYPLGYFIAWPSNFPISEWSIRFPR